MKELRSWFDNRLEEAIKAAEEESKLDLEKGTLHTFNPFCLHASGVALVYFSYIMSLC